MQSVIASVGKQVTFKEVTPDTAESQALVAATKLSKIINTKGGKPNK